MPSICYFCEFGLKLNSDVQNVISIAFCEFRRWPLLLGTPGKRDFGLISGKTRLEKKYNFPNIT